MVYPPGHGRGHTSAWSAREARPPEEAFVGESERMYKKRSQLIAQAGGERYVTVEEVARRARVPKVHATTAARYLAEFGVRWRRMREKPPRTGAHEEDQVLVTGFPENTDLYSQRLQLASQLT